MKRIAIYAAIAACTAALPAHANTGIGFLVVWIPAAIVALLPAILIEAAILAKLLAMRFPRALSISAAANIVSTVAGAAIAMGVDILLAVATGSSGAPPGREGSLVALVPMFLVTWWLEHAVVRRMLRASGTAPRKRVTFIANAVTYALMAIAICVWVPRYGESLTREGVSMALSRMSVVKMEVSEYFEVHKAFPSPRSYPTADPHVKSLVLEPAGRIVLTFSFPKSPADDGRRIVYEPRVMDAKIVEWKCSSPDTKPRYLPAVCR